MRGGYDRLGSPEGELRSRIAVGVPGVCAKEQRPYIRSDGKTRADVEKFGTLDVPLRFRNAPTV